MSLKETKSSPADKPADDPQEIRWRHMTRHYSPEFQEAFIQYQRTGDRTLLIELAAGLLEFHVETLDREFIESKGESLSLKTDLGTDSIALAEVAFAVEGLFGAHMTNEDLIALETLNDLADFIERKRSDA